MLNKEKKLLIKQLSFMIFVFLLLLIIVFLSIRSVKGNLNNNVEISNIKTLRGSLSLYFYNYNHFPKTPTKEDCGVYKGNISGCCFSSELGFNKECKGNIYIQKIPFDSNGKSYSYISNEDESNYTLKYSIGSELSGFKFGDNMATADSISQ